MASTRVQHRAQGRRGWLVLAALAIASTALACRSQGPSGSLPNVVLITLDTTRADHIGCYGGRDASTPVIDGLAAQGARFERAFTPVPITLPSHATIMTGLLPAAHGVHDNTLDRLGDDVPTLAAILKERGYETGAFIGAAVLSGRYGLARGFDRYDDDLIGAMKEIATLSFVERRAENVTQSALTWLGERSPEKPFLIWAHYFDPHGDYVPPPPFAEKFREHPYDGEIAYADHWTGELLGEVRRRSGQRPVLTIVVADHGEGLGEHGEQAHGIFLYDSTLHVPLVVHFPGRVAPGTVVPDLVGTDEILATALELIGVPVPRSIEGESLVPLLNGKRRARRDPLFLETMLPKNLIGWTAIAGVRTAELKYVESPKPELYDLAKDPKETANVAGERAAEVGDLGKQLSKYRAASAEHAREASRPPDLDEATRQRLAALGYAVDAEAEGTAQRTDPKDLVELFNGLFGSIELLAQRKWTEARTLLLRVLELHPRHVGAMVMVGETYRRRALEGGAESDPTDLPNAEKWFRRGLETDETWAPAHLGMGRILAARGDLDGALEHFRRATELRPELYDARTEMALLLVRRGDHGRATAELEEVVRVHPEQSEAHRHLGALYRAAARDTDALREYELAVRLAPKDPAARFLLGRLLRDLGRVDEAAASFAAAVQSNPQAAYARVDLAELYAKAGKRDAARQQYEAATQVADSAPSAYHGLGVLDLDEGNLQAAEASFQAALDRRPNFTPASLRLAQLFEKRGERERALETLRTAQARDPGNEELKKQLSALEGGGASALEPGASR